MAQLVAEGATNREFHLRDVYRKLGLRSRPDLARLGGREGAPGDAFFSLARYPTAKT